MLLEMGLGVVAICGGIQGLRWRRLVKTLERRSLYMSSTPVRYETCGGCGASIPEGAVCYPIEQRDDWGQVQAESRLINCQWDRAPGVPIANVAFEP